MSHFLTHPALADLQPLLAHQDPEVRRIALLRAIDLVGDDDARLFVRASSDPAPEVRLEAVRALEGKGDIEAVAALLGRLDDDNEEVRQAAAESLAELRDASAGAILVGGFASATNPWARSSILAALRNLRLPQAYEIAVASLSDSLPSVRREAVGVLAYLRDSRALPHLARSVQDSDTQVRRSAVGALGFAEDDSVLPALLGALKDSDWQIREEAAVTLGKVLIPAAAEGLIAVLANDSFWQVRLKAATSLGKLRDRRALPALVAALGHEISNLRKEAASALGEIGDVRAIPALNEALADADIEVRKVAQTALSRITTHKHG